MAKRVHFLSAGALVLAGFLVGGCEKNKGLTAAQIYEESMRQNRSQSMDYKELGVPAFPGSQPLGSAYKVAGALNVVFMTKKPVVEVEKFYVKSLKGELSKQSTLSIVRGKTPKGLTTFATIRRIGDETEITMNVFDPGAEPDDTAPQP